MWNISVSLTIASMCVVTVMCIPVMPDTRINGTEAENILYGKLSSDKNAESVWMFILKFTVPKLCNYY